MHCVWLGLCYNLSMGNENLIISIVKIVRALLVALNVVVNCILENIINSKAFRVPCPEIISILINKSYDGVVSFFLASNKNFARAPSV